jgi:hypothetical protein
MALGAYGTYRYFTNWKWQFEHSPSLVLYSVYPSAVPTDSPILHNKIPNVYQWRFLDKKVVSAPAEKEQLIEATQRALTEPRRRTIAKCFSPRHAVATVDGKTTVLICFECGQAEILTRQGNRTIIVNRSARPLFESLISKYGLKAEPAD